MVENKEEQCKIHREKKKRRHRVVEEGERRIEREGIL